MPSTRLFLAFVVATMYASAVARPLQSTRSASGGLTQHTLSISSARTLLLLSKRATGRVAKTGGQKNKSATKRASKDATTADASTVNPIAATVAALKSGDTIKKRRTKRASALVAGAVSDPIIAQQRLASKRASVRQQPRTA